jgi:hypothetical protein
MLQEPAPITGTNMHHYMHQRGQGISLASKHPRTATHAVERSPPWTLIVITDDLAHVECVDMHAADREALHAHMLRCFPENRYALSRYRCQDQSCYFCCDVTRIPLLCVVD